MGKAKKKEFDIWKDSRKIEELLCPYCNQDYLVLHVASGYEMHFRDSDYLCHFCFRTYSVYPFFRCKTLNEVKKLLEKMGDGYRKMIQGSLKEVEAKYNRLRELRKKDYKFNPSKKIEEISKDGQAKD